MNTKIAAMVVFFVATGLVGNAFAHKSQVIGDYDIEVGWVKEPPVAGKKNAIEIVIAKAAPSDKKASQDSHDHKDSEKKTTTKKIHSHKSGVKGLAKVIEVDVTLNGKKTTLTIKEDPKKAGTYTGEYTPEGEGHPTVHIYAKIKTKEIEGAFHPEKVKTQ
ncbi:MAG: hypothetical protein ACKO7N_00220 [Candidatus Nitrosotenuis sp.]